MDQWSAAALGLVAGIALLTIWGGRQKLEAQDDEADPWTPVGEMAPPVVDLRSYARATAEARRRRVSGVPPTVTCDQGVESRGDQPA